MIVRREMGRSIELETGIHSDAPPDDSTRETAEPKARRSRSAVLGLHASRGFAWAEVIPEADVERVALALSDRKSVQSVNPFPGAHRYAAVVYGGRLYRLTSSSSSAAARFGHVESFWSYLQRRLKSKGGIRRKHLGLYLAEYAWRYNHRNQSAAEQLRETLALVRRAQVAGMSLTPRARAR